MTSARKASMKTFTGSLIQTPRPWTGQERKPHSPQTDLDQLLSHQLLWLKDSQRFFQDSSRERAFLRRVWTRMFTISPTINQRSQDNPIQELRLQWDPMEVDQRLSQLFLKDKEYQYHLPSAGTESKTIHLVLKTVQVPVLSHQFLMSQSTPIIKLYHQLERSRRISQRKESMKMFTILLTIKMLSQDSHTQEPKLQWTQMEADQRPSQQHLLKDQL